MFYIVKTKLLNLFDEKIIIDSGATDTFFANCAYFSIYEEYYHEFQTGQGGIISVNGYSNIILLLAYLDSLKVI